MSSRLKVIDDEMKHAMTRKVSYFETETNTLIKDDNHHSSVITMAITIQVSYNLNFFSFKLEVFMFHAARAFTYS